MGRKIQLPPKPRRPRGTGSLFFDKNQGIWIGRVPVGRTLAGKTKYVQVQAAKQSECIDKMAQASPPRAGITVAEWCERWFRLLTVRDSTRDDYRHTLDKFIVPTLGHLRLSALSASQVEEALKIWLQRLGPNTARKNLGHLRSCLEAARRDGLVLSNPARDCRKPKAKRIVVATFTPTELRAIIESPRSGIFALMASVGCRIGEALALDVTDFDPKAGTVHIHRTYSRKHGTRPPKSENGIRTVRIPAPALPAIREAASGRKRGPLFPTYSPEMGRRQHSTIRSEWRVVLKRLGLAYRRPHVLRHSVGSYLASCGLSPADIAKYLGDSVDVIVKSYLHATGADVAGVMEAALTRTGQKRA